MTTVASSPFLRHPQRTRRRRRHPMLRLAGRLLRVGLAAVLPIALGWWAMTAESLRLVEIRAVGSERVPAEWVEEALGGWRGDNLLLLPLSRVEAVLLRHPWIASVTARKEMPGRLVVEIHDRPAAALLVIGGEEFLVDAGGARIVAREGVGPVPSLRLVMAIADPLPEMGGFSESDLIRRALDLDRRIEALAPAWSRGLDTIEILGEHDFRLWHGDLDYPILAGAAELDETLPAFRELEPEIHRRYPQVETVDLRIRGRIVVRPLPSESGWSASETRGS